MMDYGRSLVRNCLMHASEIGYGDCAELQIVCPHRDCASPLRKKGSTYTKLEYLSHFVNPYADCELRVRRIIREELHVRVITVPTGETLAAFLVKFEQIVLERTPGGSAWMSSVLDPMRRRPAYRKAVQLVNQGCRKRLNEITEITLPGFEVTPAELLAAQHTVRYLCAPNTFRVFLFAISFDVVLKRFYDHLNGEKPPSGGLSDRAWYEVLTRATNSEFKKWWNTLPQPQMDIVCSGMVEMVCATALNFVNAVSSTPR